jgi:1,4-alpha-glucan branching enzyme
VLSYLRRSNDGHAVVVLNLTPQPHPRYRIGVPESGDYSCVLSSDARDWGGSGYGAAALVHADDIPYHGRRYSVELALPPLAAILLVPSNQAPKAP